MKTKTKFCQSCGMPLNQDPKNGGTNSDGSVNEKYCSYCFQNGSFTFQGTVKEMQEFCKGKMKEKGFSGFTAWLYTRGIKRLERWKENK